MLLSAVESHTHTHTHTHTHLDHPRGGTACCPASQNAVLQPLRSSRAVMSCTHILSDHPRGGTACCPASQNAVLQLLRSSRAVMSCTHPLRSPTRRYSMLPCSMECYAIIVLLTCSHVLHTPTQIIHEEVQHAALQLGMIPLQRLSAQHATTLSRVAGAIPINSWHPTASDSWRQLLGVVGGVRQQVRRHRERC